MAITVSGVTCSPKSEYTPTVTRRSWSMATKAATAIFVSKRILMYAVTAMKNTMSASSALSVIWPPHVGPTLLVDT